MQTQVNFTLGTSGAPFVVPNNLNSGNNTSITVTYKVSGSPDSLVVSVEGLVAAGSNGVLDSYNGTTSTTRTIDLVTSGNSYSTLTGFQFCAVWTGGNDVQVAVTCVASGAGATFSAVNGDIANVHTQ